MLSSTNSPSLPSPTLEFLARVRGQMTIEAQKWVAHRAAFYDDAEALAQVSQSWNEEQWAQHDPCGNSVVHVAALRGSSRCLRLAFESGLVDRDTKNSAGWTAFQEAVAAGDARTARLIFDLTREGGHSHGSDQTRSSVSTESMHALGRVRPSPRVAKGGGQTRWARHTCYSRFPTSGCVSVGALVERRSLVGRSRSMRRRTLVSRSNLAPPPPALAPLLPGHLRVPCGRCGADEVHAAPFDSHPFAFLASAASLPVLRPPFFLSSPLTPCSLSATACTPKVTLIGCLLPP